MNFEQFQTSIRPGATPPPADVYLQSLWYDANGDWHRAHQLIQDTNDNKAAWIHAYLHRKEGDVGNADYWYHRAGRKRPAVSLDEEWQDIVRACL